MRVLYKLPERNFKTIFFAAVLMFAVLHTPLPAQRPAPTTNIWTLPLTLCGQAVSDRTNIKQLASDNVSNIYISNSNGILQSINISENKNNWSVVLGTEIISNIGSDNKNIYIVSKSISDSGLPKLRAISKLTGITNWQRDLSAANEIYLEAGEYLSVLTDKQIFLINPENGSIFKEVSEASDFPEKNFFIKFGLKYSSSFFTFLTDTGIKAPDITGLEQNAGTLIFGSRNGEIHSYNKFPAKKLWSGKAGGAVTSLTFLEENRVLVGSLDNFLYLFSAEDGDLIWKRRLPNRLTEKPLIGDGAVLIANPGGSTAFVIELEKGKVINQISLPESVYFVGNSLLIGNRIIVPTNIGILQYTRESC